MHRVEFTVEPFTEGNPGPHVTEPADALRSLGYDVEFGPFGSAAVVPEAGLAEAVAVVVHTAFAHGATHVNLDVDRIGTEAVDA